MAAASDIHPTERTLSDAEFEDLLQKTWEYVQTQKAIASNAVKVIHPFEPNSESPSWT